MADITKIEFCTLGSKSSANTARTDGIVVGAESVTFGIAVYPLPLDVKVNEYTLDLLSVTVSIAGKVNAAPFVLRLSIFPLYNKGTVPLVTEPVVCVGAVLPKVPAPVAK